MATPLPFTITVYDKAFVRKAIVSTPLQMRVIPRHNLKGTATFSLPLDHVALGDLMDAGSRVVINYRGRQVMSGPVIERSFNGPTISGSATFLVEDDFRMLHGVLGWPVPGSPITSQTAAENYVLKGKAETVVKTVIRKNMIERLGLPVTIAPDLGRGATVNLEIRMQPLFDKLFPMVELAGIGVTIKQSGAGFLVDCYVPTTYPALLNEESGIVQDWSWTNSAPKATDLVVGGRGEKKDREFRRFNSPETTATWGIVTEAYEDASDLGNELNNYYSQHDNANEAYNRSFADYNTENRELTTAKASTANAKNAFNAINVTYNPGASEYDDALSDYNSAVSRQSSQQAQYNSALADKNAALATLTTINSTYAAIRAEYEENIQLRAAEVLAEANESTGIRMVLSETDGFRYGDDVRVGDKVTMKVGPALTITDLLREAELSWTFDAGVVATPSVGDITDNPDRAFAKALRNSVSRIRKIEVK